MKKNRVLAVCIAELVGLGVLFPVFGEELLPGQLLEQRALARSHRLGNILLRLASRLAKGVYVPARIALHPADFVLVLGYDDMGRVGLALRAVRLDVGPHLVDIILEHEVHGCAPIGYDFA